MDSNYFVNTYVAGFNIKYVNYENIENCYCTIVIE